MKIGLNVGSTDRWLRILAGFVLIFLAFSPVFEGALAMTAYIIGAVAILTAVIRFCPAYTLIGMNTDQPKD